MNANGNGNDQSAASAHGPNARCDAFAAVLPVLDELALDPQEAAQARAHLASCAFCQAQAHAYERMESAVHAYLAPEAVAPYRAQPVVSDLLRDLPLAAPPARAGASTSTCAPERGAMPETPARLPLLTSPLPGRPRRFFSGVASLAAVLVIALLTAALLAGHQRQVGPGIPHVTPGPPRGSDTELAAIAMVSPTEGWAVGSARAATDANGQATQVLLMHYTQGNWSRANAAIKGVLRSISMASATDGWAVGYQGLMLHYDGHNWRQVSGPGQMDLYQVRMFSATNGFAVGAWNGGPASGILHYDGQTWTTQPLPARLEAGSQNAVSLEGLAVVSANEAWAVGSLSPIQPSPTPIGGSPTPLSVSSYPTTPPTALILHYTAGRWEVSSLLPGAALSSVAATGGNEVWADGSTETFTFTQGQPGTVDNAYPLLLRYTGGKWAAVSNQVAGQPTQTQFLGSIAMLSPTDGWMVRASEASTLLRYDGSVWNEVSVPSFQDTRAYFFTDIALTSPTSGWVVGYRLSDRAHGISASSGYGYQPTVTPIILRYQLGAWTIVVS